jgi:hypothetical protein
MPTKRQFDLILIVIVGVHLFKPLARAVLARHAASDSGLAAEAAKAGELAL